MSTAPEAARLLAAALAIQEEERRLGDQDLATQLRILTEAIRAERNLNDDRLETVMKGFDGVNARLDAIAKALGTNGSGGSHG